MSTVHAAHDVRILWKECRSLASVGYRVSFVVPHDRTEQIEGVDIIPIARGRNRLARILLAPWQAARAALRCKGDIYHLHDPELIPVALFLKLLRKKVIIDMHEDLPAQILSKRWIPKPLRRPIALTAALTQGAVGRVVDAIVAATPRIGEKLVARRVEVVQNFPSSGELISGADNAYQNRPAVFAYVGGITRIRGAREMVEAIGRLPEEYQAELRLGGPVESEELLRELEQLPGWRRARYLGKLDRAQVRHLLGDSRAGLVLVHPEPNYMESYPTKLYEYLSASIPAVASDFPYWKNSLGVEDCSIFVDPLDVDGISAAMRWVLDHPASAEAMGERGRRIVERDSNWENEAVKLIRLYGELM